MVENAYQVTLVCAFVPLLCGVYWKRSTNQGSLLSIFLGLSVWISMLMFGPEDPFIPAQLAGVLASAFGMLVGSLGPQIIPHAALAHAELFKPHHAAQLTHHVSSEPHHHPQPHPHPPQHSEGRA
jgi:Na+/proline symporter